MLHGYSDRIHHALAFTAKHYPGPVSRYDGQSCLIRASSVAVILARYGCDEATIVSSILKQLVDAADLERQPSLGLELQTKFGEPIAATVRAAAEPRFDPLGRERTWKACRFETLSRIPVGPPRAIDVMVADEFHRLGSALVSIRRLGVEYLESAGVPRPGDTRWWLSAFLEVLRRHGSWNRPEMFADFARVADDLSRRLREAGF